MRVIRRSTAAAAAWLNTAYLGSPFSSRPWITPFRDMVKARKKKKRSETNTNPNDVWTRRGRDFKQAESLSWSCE
jgi:hypothetical protein